MSKLRPLETLIIQQLDSLIQDEKSLATRYPDLQSPGADLQATASFSDQLARLSRRADRLCRLLTEMESFSTAAA